jgi:outer membrane protein assembly factor BamA
VQKHRPDYPSIKDALNALSRHNPEDKPPVRVGQIFIIGNAKTSDKAILELVPFFPGQILNYADLRIAEQNLSRLKGLKSKPKVTVIGREGDGEFRDIQITVEEK